MSEDSVMIKEIVDDFFSSFGKADDAHASVLLQMALMEAFRNNKSRLWVKSNEIVPVSGEKRQEGGTDRDGAERSRKVADPLDRFEVPTTPFGHS